MGDMTDDLLAEEDRLWFDRHYGDLDDFNAWGGRNRRRPIAKAFGSGTWAENRAARTLHPLDDPALVSDFLDQGVAWRQADTSRNDGWIAIADMEPSHALNTARYILNRARDICLVQAIADGAGDPGRRAENKGTGLDLTNTGAANAFPRTAILNEVAARGWLLDTPLVRALLARASDPPVDGKRPWETVARRNDPADSVSARTWQAMASGAER